ncbi:MAG: bifunctional diaminohydroxyphosphoribosylaminopyrimidine deaminase/5-amino-6-(5-phosphoribosylamino)uracil reductase RibD [Acidimicrobiia bacterium]|nr:bifunctional diaminohydroxyphosphoribosylaminopyrimidine deaminase/5-amino-6-(5-phosphoribosylamino)uracil reductase RibD [Acidimicrobiia bacterium]
MTHPLLNVMRRAASLARQHHPHPNPAVGAVLITDSGAVIGEGAHQKPGMPHAEIEALKTVEGATTDATMVVTMEPCAHQGRTPPCVDAIIDAGIKRVVIGGIDPDTKVSGRGMERLRQGGISVIDGVDGFDYEEVDPAYFHHRRTGRPLVTLKTASTLDGQVAAADGTSQWITGEDARRDSHRLRAANDVIMVGAGTLIADDPRLTAVTPDDDHHQPLPVVVGGARPLPSDARVWSRPHLVVSTETQEPHDTLVVSPSPDGRPNVIEMMTALADRGHLSIMVEGGPTLSSALLHEGLINRIVCYFAPALGGGVGMGMFGGAFPTLTAMTPLAIESVTMVGADIKVIATPQAS